MKKILLAFDSFKGSMDASTVCQTIANELRDDFEIVSVPMADGGEGTVDAIVNARNGQYVSVNTVDHLGRNIRTTYGLFDNVAVLEAASVCGLDLAKPEERNVMVANSFGMGDLIASALSKGAENFILAIGGTGTNDGGYGLARALGYRFFDENGKDLPASPDSLIHLEKIVPPNTDFSKYNFTIACDVKNKLCGELGASFVYGFQKGGTKEQLEHLDKCLFRLAQIIKKDLCIDVLNIEGGGAGGGLAAGLVAFCGGQMRNGYSVVSEAVDLDDLIKNVDVVVTGEGKTDKQTLFGKLPFGVAMTAKKYNKSVVLLSGTITEEGEIGMKRIGCDAFFPCVVEDKITNDIFINAIPNLKKAAKALKVWLS